MPRSITWCSFADDAGCRGVCILTGALDPLMAALEARARGINPGGELLAVPCEEQNVQPATFELMWSHRDRLMSKEEEEAAAIFEAKSLREFEAEGSEI